MKTVNRITDTQPIAIIGMACIFPGAPDLDSFWQNILAGVDAITEVPKHRWDSAVYYDTESKALDKFYCRRGGFIDDYTDFDPLAFGIMPIAAEAAEPDQMLLLRVGAEALADAGYIEADFNRERTGVIVGRGNYLGASMGRIIQHVFVAVQLEKTLRQIMGPTVDEKMIQKVKADFQSKLQHFGPDSIIGVVPNLTASRLANRLNLHGPAYTLDAACASALLAVDQACRELQSKRCDMMLVGGASLTQDTAFWTVFNQLGALSRRQEIRPFDSKADGMLVGEGIGMAILKRLEDAERDEDRIYAVIRGVGVSSDGMASSVMFPAVEGQLLALKRAWGESGCNPETIGYVEGHGTATVGGDMAELKTLKAFFGTKSAEAPIAGLGSVKSMIGHTMPAAGIASLIKTAKAVYHGVLPPTLHCENPRQELEETRFRPIYQKESWPEFTNGPRCAGINAFGFGGINAHVVLESHTQSNVQTSAVHLPKLPSMVKVTAPTVESLLSKLEHEEFLSQSQAHDNLEDRYRLVIIEPTPERLLQAQKIVKKGVVWRGHQNIYYSPNGLGFQGGQIALIFPGLDSYFRPQTDDDALARYFNIPSLLPKQSDSDDKIEVWKMTIDVLLSNYFFYQVLRQLGVEPAMLGGHSVGEWTAMFAAGCVPENSLRQFLSILSSEGAVNEKVEFLAVGCGIDKAHQAIQGLKEVYISHDNCPHQVIVCGTADQLDIAQYRFKKMKVLLQRLPFRSGFHSPHLERYAAHFRTGFDILEVHPYQIPLWSATTCQPYPKEPSAIYTLFFEHLVKQVRFRTLIETLYEQGARFFIQAGSGNLPGFISDTLKDKSHLTISTSVPKRSNLEQICHVLAALWVEGVAVNWEGLLQPSKKVSPSYTTRQLNSKTAMKLKLGVPLIDIDTKLSHAITEVPIAGDVDDPIQGEFQKTLQHIQNAGTEVFRAWQDHQVAIGDLASPKQKIFHEEISLDNYPDLIDHTIFRQKEGWPIIADLWPVVPLTMSLELILKAARAFAPEQVVIALEEVRAFKWISVREPLEIDVIVSKKAVDRLFITIEDYCQAEAVLSNSYPEPPKPNTNIGENRHTCPTANGSIYTEHWMFHGPAYQGLTTVGPLSDQGIQGRITVPAGLGALMDNAGQLAGHWIQIMQNIDFVAFPIGIKRIAYFSAAPTFGEVVDCFVWTKRIRETIIRSDLELHYKGRVFASVEGWKTQRFSMDKILWDILRFPHNNLIARTHEGGFVAYVDKYPASQFFIAGRLLSFSEYEIYESLTLNNKKRFLCDCVAVKEAVRHWIWTTQGKYPRFPAEVRIEFNEQGEAIAHGPFKEKLSLSVAYEGDITVAVADAQHKVCIEIVSIKDKNVLQDHAFLQSSERALLSSDDNQMIARVWAAKKVVGKYRKLTSQDAIKALPLKEIEDQNCLIDQVWVETYQVEKHIVAVIKSMEQ